MVLILDFYLFFCIQLHCDKDFISILIECFFHNIFSFLSGLSIIRQALFLVYIQVILQLPYHIVAKSVPLAHTGLGLAVFTITSAYPMPPDTSHVSLLKSHLYMHRHTKRFPFPCLRTRLLSIHFDKFLIYFF